MSALADRPRGLTPPRRRLRAAAVLTLSAVAWTPAWGQALPGQAPGPSAPASPPAPSAPPSPAAPGPAVGSELALAFLFVGARTASPDAVVVRLADALLGLFPDDRVASRGDVTPLARVLDESLRRRQLEPDASRRLASELAVALTIITRQTEPSPARWGRILDAARTVDEALVEVREALAAAGLRPSDIVLIEAEVSRLAPISRARRR